MESHIKTIYLHNKPIKWINNERFESAESCFSRTVE